MTNGYQQLHLPSFKKNLTMFLFKINIILHPQRLTVLFKMNQDLKFKFSWQDNLSVCAQVSFEIQNTSCVLNHEQPKGHWLIKVNNNN